jgi:hypothetical protein
LKREEEINKMLLSGSFFVSSVSLLFLVLASYFLFVVSFFYLFRIQEGIEVHSSSSTGKGSFLFLPVAPSVSVHVLTPFLFFLSFLRSLFLLLL